MVEIAVGNLYGHGFDAPMVAELAKLGFVLRPDVSRYAGSQVMRFIDFDHGPALELVEVADPKEYAEFVPKGMVPFCPGISLLLPSGSRKDLESLADTFAQLSPYILHVNYDGTRDPGRPGWTYLNFGVPIVRDTFIYLTVRDEPRPSQTRVVTHPNGVTGVEGLWFDVDAEELRNLANLVGTDLVDDAVRIGGVTAWSRSAVRSENSRGNKRFPLHDVVLEAPVTPGSELSHATGRRTTFQSKSALRIETNPLCWDLLLLGEGPDDSVHGQGPR